MSNWVYRQTEWTLWTTGYYAPDGNWVPDRDCSTQAEAAQRVHWLNGGNATKEEHHAT